MERGEAVGMELTPVETFSSSYSSSSSLPSEEGAPAIVKVTWVSLNELLGFPFFFFCDFAHRYVLLY